MYLFIKTPQSKRRASGERPPSSAQCWLNEKTPNLPSFSCKISSFWLLVRTRHPRQRENFAIIRSIQPWKLPHLASASLLTAASEVLSISSSSPAPSALSDVRLYHTALGDTIAKHAWSLCPYQSALMLQRSAERSGVGDPSCVALLLLVLLLAPLLAAQRERDSHPRSGKIFPSCLLK